MDFNVIVIDAVAALIVALSTFLCVFIKNKTEQLKLVSNNETVNKYIGIATEVITDCVNMVTQTYVETLKKQNKFDKEAQQEAFSQCKQQVLNLLTDEAKLVIQEVYGDIDKWIDTKIESTVNINKNVTT